MTEIKAISVLHIQATDGSDFCVEVFVSTGEEPQFGKLEDIDKMIKWSW